MTDLRIVFAGTPEFAACSLAALLLAEYRPQLVLTQPDRPAGRGRRLTASPVKQLANVHGIDVFQPKSLRAADVQERLRAVRPDFLIVAAYGLLLPQAVLDIPRIAPLNVHASLLPRWRGAAPIQAAILAGDNATGVGLMKMEAGLDTGPVYANAALEIDHQENAAALHDRLAELGGRMLCEKLEAIASGDLQPQAQDDAEATYAPRLQKADARIDWSKSAAELAREVRAYNAWPVAHTHLDGQLLRIWEASSSDEPNEAIQPGEIRVIDECPQVATAAGWLKLARVQLAGRKQISGAELARQRPLDGLILGQ